MRMEEETKRFQMLDLPLHILWDIFVNLPPRSLISTAAVCSTFRNIVADHSFRQLYYSRSPTSCILLCDSLRLSQLPEPAPSPPPSPSSCAANCPSANTSASSSSGIDLNGPPEPQPQPQPQPEPDATDAKFIALDTPMKLVNSSRGLLCLRSPSLYLLCNPLLGQLLTLPPPPSQPPSAVYSAFGYDPLSKRYKLLQILPSNSVHLYRLGDHTWRLSLSPSPNSSNPIPIPIPNTDSSFDPSLNGALHWIANTATLSQFIGSFDLHTEQFRAVPAPSHLNLNLPLVGVCVGVLKGNLCLCYVNQGSFETWVMEEYGVQASWARAFSIDINSYCGLSLGRHHRPIGFSSCGEMWVKADQSLVSYNSRIGIFRHLEIGIPGIPGGGDSQRNLLEAVPHVFTFVSLKQFLHFTNPHLRLRILAPTKNHSHRNSTFFPIN